MRGSHGDQNSEKKNLEIYKVAKQQKCNLKHKNVNILFRVFLTCDRRYNTFDLKKKNYHYNEDLIFKKIF